MKGFILLGLYVLGITFCGVAQSAEALKSSKGKKNLSHSFDSQLVEGKIYRPELSVVTGDLSLEGLGVLKLRDGFSDQAHREALAGFTDEVSSATSQEAR